MRYSTGDKIGMVIFIIGYLAMLFAGVVLFRECNRLENAFNEKPWLVLLIYPGMGSWICLPLYLMAGITDYWRQLKKVHRRKAELFKRLRIQKGSV